MDANAQKAHWLMQLSRGLASLQIDLNGVQQQLLVDYLALLCKWNRAYNLTAIRDPEAVVSRQLLDSLAVLPLLAGQRMLDLGSGPGLPGIPLAIARPDIDFVLLDANGKKCRFMEQAKLELSIPNISVVSTRVAQYRPDTCFDLVLSRAFASLAGMIDAATHLLAPGGGMLALKGKLPNEELAGLDQRGFAHEVYRISVPGTDGERHAIHLFPIGGRALAVQDRS